MNSSEEEIIYELKAGNRKIFEQIFRKYYPMLCYEARENFKADYLAEEIVCDVFTKIWENRDSLKIQTSLREYLVKSVYNRCIDYYRFQKTQEKLKLEIDETQKKIILYDLGEDPLEYIITQELEDRIYSAIESLPVQYRKAFELSRFSDFTYDEIASEMGISVNSVKTNIKNALAKLREKLSDLFILFLLFF
jgi:RNA polymerase sigma-70 factor, ECF subfamily